MKEIYIQWNKITCVGGELIFKELTYNYSLQVFDISWNNLGDKIERICECLKINTTLVHVDLSFNKFTY